MEGRTALSVGNLPTPTRVKASLASIPVGTESLITKAVAASRMY